MNHLDEGTIHAWLDGALDATRAAEVQAHVRECTSCAEAVAEARGLIAGASRILTALDEVPAGVIPGAKAPVAPAPVHARPRRMWRAAPWVTGIAAVLLGAVVLTTSRKAAPDVFERPAVSGDTLDTAAALLQTKDRYDFVRDSIAKALRRAEASRVAGGPTVYPAPAPAAPPSVTSRRIAASAEAAQSAPEARRLGSGVGSAGASSAVTGAGRAPSAAPPSTILMADSGRRRDVASAAAADAREEASKAAMGTISIVQSMAGCYTVAALPRPQAADEAVPPLQPRTATAAARARAVAPAPSAAPTREAQAPPPTPAAFVELLEARETTGAIARDPATGAALGTWVPVARDTAEVTLRAGGTLRIARGAKADCPRQQ